MNTYSFDDGGGVPQVIPVGDVVRLDPFGGGGDESLQATFDRLDNRKTLGASGLRAANPLSVDRAKDSGVLKIFPSPKGMDVGGDVGDQSQMFSGPMGAGPMGFDAPGASPGKIGASIVPKIQSQPNQGGQSGPWGKYMFMQQPQMPGQQKQQQGGMGGINPAQLGSMMGGGGGKGSMMGGAGNIGADLGLSGDAAEAVDVAAEVAPEVMAADGGGIDDYPTIGPGAPPPRPPRKPPGHTYEGAPPSPPGHFDFMPQTPNEWRQGNRFTASGGAVSPMHMGEGFGNDDVDSQVGLDALGNVISDTGNYIGQSIKHATSPVDPSAPGLDVGAMQGKASLYNEPSDDTLVSGAGHSEDWRNPDTMLPRPDYPPHQPLDTSLTPMLPKQEAVNDISGFRPTVTALDPPDILADSNDERRASVPTGEQFGPPTHFAGDVPMPQPRPPMGATAMAALPPPHARPTQGGPGGGGSGGRGAAGPMGGQPAYQPPYPDATQRDWGQNITRSPWMALVNAGARMAQTRGPIGSVIGAGIESGAHTLDQQRAELRTEEQINQKAQALHDAAQRHLDAYTKMTPAQRDASARGWEHINLMKDRFGNINPAAIRKEIEGEADWAGRSGPEKDAETARRVQMYTRQLQDRLLLGGGQPGQTTPLGQGAPAPQVGETRQFKQGMGRWDGTQWVPVQ